jgi:long-chain acyl-CoA synthetase
MFGSLFGSDLSVIQIDGPHPEDETPILRGPTAPPNSFLTGFPDAPEIKTVHEVLSFTLKHFPTNRAFGTRVYDNGKFTNDYQYITFTEFGEMRSAVGSYLVDNHKPNEQRIGIMSYSRLEWDVVQFACYSQKLVVVPVYDTFGADNVRYIINHTELQTIFVLASKLKFLATDILPHCATIKELIVIEGPEKVDLSSLSIDASVKITPYRTAVEYPERRPFNLPTESDLCCITFTSGTTSVPKGVQLTHHNLVAATGAMSVALMRFAPTDRYFSYLPLAHILEFIIHILVIYVGAPCGYFSGSITRLTEDVGVFKPTVFVGVGRVFERILTGITDKINAKPFYVRWLLNAAIAFKGFMLSNFRVRRVPVIESIFRPIRAAFGGCLRCIVLAGSPFPAPSQRWLGLVLGSPFGTGYGLTETAVAATIQNLDNDTACGSIGVPLGCNELKLKSVPELGYDVHDRVGEIYFRGESIFHGYYKNDEETAKVLKDGWFKTGDIGRLSSSGQLYLVGRNKDTVKLLQGEYVAIPRLTEIFQRAAFVNQLYLHAGMYARFLSAIVVLRSDAQKLTERDVIKEFDRIADENRLMGYERIKRVYLTDQEFTLENGCLTPSLKPAGHRIQALYAEQLRQLEKSE